MDHAEDTTSVDAAEEIVRLIAQAQRRLYAFVFALVRRSADADDVLQEINVVLWRKRDAYRPGTNFLAWAFEIARLQVLAHRARCARSEDPFDAALLAEIAEAARIESAEFDRREAALRSCLQKLPEEQRALIVRRYQPDVAVNSLAAELGKTSKAVSESLRRIREALRQCIERTLAAELRS
ncbi:sigma-70 family RNA polymerase sigma factor [Planctellipticum variicoloris]|jgi:RNA polymerase sigma-70 factor (ECF subfamily)|uniref:sigma-70 family RNA polymerase sigma factor n=1 Tax=Planctellipticum variicoloris TaxID=3064265 RepID=UPI00301408FC|nr:sigma-70 family RNA polymerase sigma factor [Planctomycetaceae bacterium SH412]